MAKNINAASRLHNMPVFTVSLETMKIVHGLPGLGI
jgi:hypothetical protein